MLRDLFSFYSEDSRKRFRIVIGQELRRCVTLLDSNKNVISADSFNSIDRVDVAKKFIDIRTYSGKYSISFFYDVITSYTDEDMLRDIAEYIDLILPKRYFIALKEHECKGKYNKKVIKNWYNGISELEGIIFKYKDNYEREGYATDKKQEQLSSTMEQYIQEGPYKEFPDVVLYNMILKDAKETGYKLTKDENNISRVDMIRLLNFFYKDSPMNDLFNFVEYA